MKIAMRGSGHNVVGATDYYMRKFNFLREYHFFDTEEIAFQTDCTEDLVKQNMACLRQLLIEVTDKCNLKCKYCGYGEFYSNYDRRETCNQTFDNVKVLIDYLTNLWRSDYNVSHNNTVTVGFYGGEPLLNMKLIQETIAYMESLHIDNLRFSYNMTTNAMLLGRYMDYLVEKDFTLLISLDGDEYQSGYRVDKHGNLLLLMLWEIYRN
ncbi:radical SAM protein [Bacteroides fragilis]